MLINGSRISVILQSQKFTSAGGNCRGFCRGKRCFYSYHLGKNITEVIILQQIYIQFTIFNIYFSTKLSCTNKRYNAVWIGTTPLQDRKNEMRRKMDRVQNLMIQTVMLMTTKIHIHRGINQVLALNLKVTLRTKFRLHIILLIIYCLYYFCSFISPKRQSANKKTNEISP